jgi:CBS domain-containing protein
MTRHVECIQPSDSIMRAAERMRDLDVGALPVCQEDRLAGMITDRDITIRATAIGSDPNRTIVADVLTPELVYCFEDDQIAEAVQIMEDNKIRRLPVLNRDKRLVGIVSLGDLAVKVHDEHLSAAALECISEPVAAI